MYYDNTTNRNAIIKNRVLRNGNSRTETARRDPGSFKASITSDKKTGRIGLSLVSENGLVMRLNGRQARTLFRVLSSHYETVNKSY